MEEESKSIFDAHALQ